MIGLLLICFVMIFSKPLSGAELKKDEYNSTIITTAEPESKISTAFFSPDKTRIAALTALEAIYITNLDKSNSPKKLIKLKSFFANEFNWCGAFSPNNNLLALGKDNDTIEIWNAEQYTFNIAWHYSFHPEEKIQALAFNKQSNKLIIGHTDFNKPVMIIDIETGKQISSLQSLHSISTLHVNNKNIAALGFEKEDESIALWDFHNNHIIRKIPQAYGIVKTITLNEQETLYGMGFEKTTLTEKNEPITRTATINVYDILNNCSLCTARHTFDSIDIDEKDGFPILHSLSFSPDSCSLATAISNKIYVQMLKDMQDNKKSMKILQGHADYITQLVMPQNNIIYSTSIDKTMRIWDITKTSNQPEEKRAQSCLLM
ncbi:MAG: WD40 repeat domain-containing protein [Candidatus Dependentiae bacterium]